MVFNRPEIVDFGVWAAIGRPGYLSKRLGAKPPTFSEAWAARGRPDPQNRPQPVGQNHVLKNLGCISTPPHKNIPREGGWGGGGEGDWGGVGWGRGRGGGGMSKSQTSCPCKRNPLVEPNSSKRRHPHPGRATKTWYRAGNRRVGLVTPPPS